MLNNHPDDITIQNGNTVIRINKDTFRGIIDYDIENDVYSFSYQDQKGNLKNIRVERNTDPDAFAQIKDYMGSLDGGL